MLYNTWNLACALTHPHITKLPSLSQASSPIPRQNSQRTHNEKPIKFQLQNKSQLINNNKKTSEIYSLSLILINNEFVTL